MASFQNIGLCGATFKADTDLSSYQYYAVMAASVDGYVKLCTGGSDPTPMGVLQDNVGDTVGDAIEVGMLGPMLAQVAACDIGGEACPIGFWDALVCGSGGVLVRAGSNSAYNAYSMNSISTACNQEIIQVFWCGPTSSCSVAAS